MTDARTKQVQEIEGLLAERRKYEQWLAQLEARKESTPSHVFVKVHRDYSTRLGEAQAKLSSESGAVRALAAELEDSLAAVEKQISERTDERAEAELRASVGEFAGKEWDKLRGKLDGAIADLSGERDGLQRELDTLRALLDEAEPSADGSAPKTDVDDIAFLRSVLGRSTPYQSAQVPVVPEAPAVERPAARASVPVEKRPSVKTTAAEEPAKAAAARAEAPQAEAPRAEPEAPRASAPTRSSTAAGSSRGSGSAAAASAREAAPELFATPDVPEAPDAPRGTDDHRPERPSGTFGLATPRTQEAVKSLKCQECGTLNFPTEWYCERCGGELAAF